MRFRHDDMCERAAPDDGCGCRSRLLSCEQPPADDAGEAVTLVPDDMDCDHRIWVRDDEGGELWSCPLCMYMEARAEADNLRAEVERLRDELLHTSRVLANERATCRCDEIRFDPVSLADVRERLAQAILNGCDDIAVQPCRACRQAAAIVHSEAVTSNG